MGKRKLNGTTFYQCDWSGFALKSAHCYMPQWNGDGKMSKRGSYANWESVVAHAEYQKDKGLMTGEQCAEVHVHVASICGTSPSPAPHYEKLAHTKGSMRESEYHKACTLETRDVCGVLLTENSAQQIKMCPVHQQPNYAEHMQEPSQPVQLAHFQSMRRKNFAYDINVYYYPVKDMPLNQIASNMFRMQLYGDVLLVAQSKENSFLPRERIVDFTLGMFEDLTKKRKREVPSLSPAEFKEAQKTMKAELAAFETNVSADAVGLVTVTPEAAKHTLASVIQRQPPKVVRQNASGHASGR
jgi:hypothetical protein